MERRTRRFPIMLTEQEETAIQKYRFQNEISTKAEAARLLIEKGLRAKTEATTGDEIGVLTPAGAGENNPA